jgi:predicted amidohydrolase
VIYCNRVGWEEGSFYSGGSLVVRPGGEVLERAPFLDQHLLIAEIDLREVDRLRWRLPLIKAKRSDIEGAS